MVIDPVTAERIFANKLFNTFKLVIEDVAATRELVFKLVVVAFVIVEFEDVRKEVDAVKIFAESELVVDALVVEALSV